jgi:cell division protein FtsW (lipid II flippase)
MALRVEQRRRSEVGLLFVAVVVILFAYLLASLGTYDRLPPNVWEFLGVLAAIALFVNVANRFLAPQADPVMMPVVLMLNGIGFVMIYRLNDPVDAPWRYQAIWTVLGVAAYVVTLAVVRRSRDLERYRYLLLLIGGILLVAPLFFSPINGARLWVHYGSLSFQPIEFAKILLCIYFASYFAANKEILSIPTARIGNRLFLDPRPLIPILVAWGAAMTTSVSLPSSSPSSSAYCG